jgi:hypothetical protein
MITTPQRKLQLQTTRRPLARCRAGALVMLIEQGGVTECEQHGHYLGRADPEAWNRARDEELAKPNRVRALRSVTKTGGRHQLVGRHSTIDRPTIDGSAIHRPAINVLIIHGLTIDGPAIRIRGTIIERSAIRGHTIDGTTIRGLRIYGRTIHESTIHGRTIHRSTIHGPTIRRSTIRRSTIHGLTIHGRRSTHIDGGREVRCEAGRRD